MVEKLLATVEERKLFKANKEAAARKDVPKTVTLKKGMQTIVSGNRWSVAGIKPSPLRLLVLWIWRK